MTCIQNQAIVCSKKYNSVIIYSPRVVPNPDEAIIFL